MKREDLFAAIGAVEECRLARSELTVQEPSLPKTEEPDMKHKKVNTKRVIRNLLVAAVIVSMVAVTAFAATGYLLYGSPAEMLSSIFGDETGYDHSEGGAKYYEDGKLAAMEPSFNRVPADETVVAVDVAPNVDIVGQSISFNGFTLTVDAFMYDSTTKCGFFTYLLENPNGVSGYKTQTTGEIWYDGAPDIVRVNQYGYPYIIQEKTTDTCLAATYYFQYDRRWGDDLVISFAADEKQLSDEETAGIITELEKKIREEKTPEQAIAEVIDILGAATFEENVSNPPDGNNVDMEAYRADYAYTVLTHRRYQEQYQSSGARLTVDCGAEKALRNVTMENGSIVVSPISMQIDVTNLAYLHETRDGKLYVHSDNVDTVKIRYQDGTEYVVDEEYTKNYTFSACGSATEGEKDNYNMLTYMFNRIINVDDVKSIIINGLEIPVD